MSRHERKTAGERPTAASYEIKVKGKLTATLVAELGADLEPDADTTLRVDVSDRAGLHSFMDRVEDLGLEVISINPATGPPAKDRTSE